MSHTHLGSSATTLHLGAEVWSGSSFSCPLPPSLSPEATSRSECWKGYFVGHNYRTEEGDRLVASGVKLQGSVEAG